MKLTSIIPIAISVLILSACTKLDEKLFDKVESANYGKTPAEVETIVGKAYSTLRGGSSDGVAFFPTSEFVFFVSAISSDECVIPTRVGGDWYDDGVFIQLQKHTWTPTNPKIWAPWKYAYNGVATTNAIIYQVANSSLTAEAKRPLNAELKVLRAYYYYKLLDMYGNVPIDTSYIVTGPAKTSPRADVYKFVEKELVDNIAYLPKVGYGRFTQDAANVLLARLYLNAEVYTGTPRWRECLDACSNVTGQLEPDYFTSFSQTNQKSKEIILGIPYNNKSGTLGNYMASMTYHYDQKWAFSVTGNYQWCGNGIAAQPGLYSSFDKDDIRRKSIRIGKQIDLRTGAVISMSASGNPLIYTEEIESITAALQNEGARLSKYEDKEGDSWERDYDMVLMRYAEVLMMQAECYVRLNNPDAARPLVEKIRTRASLTTPATIDLKFIDEELRREFVFEDHRRTDNIRFGTFFKGWWEKGVDAADKHTGIFPIPQQERNKNNLLTQNPGYPN